MDKAKREGTLSSISSRTRSNNRWLLASYCTPTIAQREYKMMLSQIEATIKKLSIG
jgi:hypothetical protein